MKTISKMTQVELAAYVQSHLLKKGITVILSGGAAGDGKFERCNNCAN
jgi:hypothetical protein